MIHSFGDQATEDLFHGNNTAKVRKLPQKIREKALNKLDMVNAAVRLSDLRFPPGNRLEGLSGDLAGWHSIRINRQWRVIFRWDQDVAKEVTVCDYH